MGILRNTKEFFRRNPALELLAGIGICTATVTPVWIFAGKYPEVKSSPLPDSYFSSKEDTESLKFKLLKENYFLMQETQKLKEKNYFLMQENEKQRKKTQLLNKESEGTSFRMP